MRRDDGVKDWFAKQRELRVKRMHREEAAFRLEQRLLRLRLLLFRDVELVVYDEEKLYVPYT
jgi:hypothetical protein